MAQLTIIEGIGPTLSEKLKKAGVGSIEELLEKGQTKKGRQQLVQATGIEETRLLRFVNYADLMRIKGVGGEYAELLEAAGVDSVPELALRNASNLHRKLVEINDQKKLVRSVASEKQVQQWVDQAGQLSKVVTH